MDATTRLRRLLALVLLVSAGLFVVGVVVERNGSESHPATQEGAGGQGSHAGEGEEGHTEEGEGGHVEEPASQPAGTETSEESRLLGIDPESTALVVVGVLASIALAVAVWRTRSRGVLWAALVFGLVFAALDIRELLHQADESNGGLVVLAGAVAVLHLGVAGLAAAALTGRRSSAVA